MLPSRLQLALAFAIVKSKPLGLAVREYISHLMHQIKRGRQPLTCSDHVYYLDAVAHWQSLYEREREENERLRREMTELKRNSEKLQRSNEVLVSHDVDVDVPLSPKRNKASSPSRSSARVRSARQIEKNGSAPKEAENTISADFNLFETLGQDGEKLTHALYTTHSLLKQSEPDPEPLCFSLEQTAISLGQVTVLIVKNYSQLSKRSSRTPDSLDQDKSDFSSGLSALARAFMSVLVGLGKLSLNNSTRAKRLPSVVVFECVQLFKTILDAIEMASRQTADAQSLSTSKTGNLNNSSPIKESVPARGVAHFLIGLLSFLEKNDALHQQIFDGFAFLLLEKVGKRLFYCTFGRHRGATIQEDIALIPEPSSKAEKSDREKEGLAVRLEAKALVLVLHRAMGLAPNHMNPQSDKAKDDNRLSRTISLKNVQPTSRARLSQMARDRLQRTLIVCMFGDRVDDDFFDVLTKPLRPAIARPSGLPNVTKVEDKDVDEWFKEQVWKLVGWDVLGRESGW